MLDETINTYHAWQLDGCSHAIDLLLPKKLEILGYLWLSIWSFAHCFRYFIHSFICLHSVVTIERLLKSSQKWIWRGWLSHYYMRAALRDSLRRMYFLTANWGCNFYWHGYSEESFQPLWYGWRCCAPAWVGLFRLQRPQKSPSTEAAMHCSIRKPWAYQSHTLSTKLLTVFLNQLMPAFVDAAAFIAITNNIKCILF